jgi:ABC-type methionine transport system permease subunit
MATRPFVVLVALIPAATAILLYTFLGNFLAGHLLLTIAALAFLAGLQLPGSAVRSTLQ